MSYATFEENHNNHDEAAAVLKRALAHTVNVDVWKYYVEYTIRQSGLKGARTAEKLKSARAAVSSAYELALDKVGTGMSSGPLWAAYISFVAEAPVSVWWCEWRASSLFVCACVLITCARLAGNRAF